MSILAVEDGPQNGPPAAPAVLRVYGRGNADCHGHLTVILVLIEKGR